MKPSQRIALIVTVLVVAVVAFVILSSGGDDEQSGQDQAVVTTETNQRPPEDTPTRTDRTTTTKPAPPPEPAVTTIEVRDGEPVGGIKDIEATSGETVEFEVDSDVPEEVHLHGYDVEKPVEPGKPARFEVDADLEGQFEIELHGTATQIGQLTVAP